MSNELKGVYVSVPVAVRAFQWSIGMKTQDFPAWFRKMVLEGNASVTIASTQMSIESDGDALIGTKKVESSEDNKITLSNKRGEYYGLPKDWVVADEYGHVFVVSQKTFNERYKSVKY